MNEGDRFCPKCGFDNWSDVNNQPQGQPTTVFPSKMEIDVGPRMATQVYPEALRQQRSMAKMFFAIVIVIFVIFLFLTLFLAQSMLTHMF